MTCLASTILEEKKHIVKLWNNSADKSFAHRIVDFLARRSLKPYATELKTSLPDASALG